MKATLNLKQDADLTVLPEAYVPKIKFEMRGGKRVAYFPEGCEFEGDHALHLVRTGQASPADDECAEACGMTGEMLRTRQRRYLAASLGISGKKDFELFMAGVIEGYAPGTTDEKPIYIPGPNYEAWEAAKKQIAEEDE